MFLTQFLSFRPKNRSYFSINCSAPHHGQKSQLILTVNIVVAVANVDVVVVIVIVVVVIVVVVAVAVDVRYKVGCEGQGSDDKVEEGQGGDRAGAVTLLAPFLLLVKDDKLSPGARAK